MPYLCWEKDKSRFICHKKINILILYYISNWLNGYKRFWKSRQLLSYSWVFQNFMNPESSSCSCLVLSSGNYPRTYHSSPYHTITSKFHLPSYYYSPTYACAIRFLYLNIMCIFSFKTICTSCPAQYIRFDFAIQTAHEEENKLLNFSLCSFFAFL